MTDQQDAFASFLRQHLDHSYEMPRDTSEELLGLVEQICHRD